MKKRFLAFILVLAALSSLLVLPVGAAGEKAYRYVLQGIVNDVEDIARQYGYFFDGYPQGGSGAFYDLNNDGVNELIIVHWKSDDFNDGSLALYAKLFTLTSNGSTPALTVNTRLYGMAGVPEGFAGIVQKNGHTYFCTFSGEGDNDNFVETCQLHTLNGTVATVAEQTHVQFRDGAVIACTLNGKAVSSTEYNTWLGSVQEVLVLHAGSSSGTGLSSLLAQIETLPDNTQPNSNEANSSSMHNFSPLHSYYSGLFWDVAADEWFEEYVGRAYTFGLMNGMGDGSFSPRSNVTLAQSITLAARLHSIYHTGSDQFAPIANAPWYHPYLVYADANRIPCGFGDLDAPATREQFAYILSAALPADELPSIPSKPWAVDFFDYNSCAYTDAIDRLTRAGIIQGIPTGSGGYLFDPSANIDRASVAAIVTRMADPSLR